MRMGTGRQLMATLVERCTNLGYRQMIAVIGDSGVDQLSRNTGLPPRRNAPVHRLQVRPLGGQCSHGPAPWRGRPLTPVSLRVSRPHRHAKSARMLPYIPPIRLRGRRNSPGALPVRRHLADGPVAQRRSFVEGPGCERASGQTAKARIVSFPAMVSSHVPLHAGSSHVSVSDGHGAVIRSLDAMFDDMACGVAADRKNPLALPGKPSNDSGCRRARMVLE